MPCTSVFWQQDRKEIIEKISRPLFSVSMIRKDFNYAISWLKNDKKCKYNANVYVKKKMKVKFWKRKKKSYLIAASSLRQQVLWSLCHLASPAALVSSSCLSCCRLWNLDDWNLKKKRTLARVIPIARGWYRRATLNVVSWNYERNGQMTLNLKVKVKDPPLSIPKENIPDGANLVIPA